MKRYIPIIFLLFFAVTLLGVGLYIKNSQQKTNTPAAPIRTELTVYSELPTNLTTLLAQQYESQYHVRVVILPITEEQMATRLHQPMQEQRGDIVLAGRQNLKVGARLQQFKPAWSEGVDEVSDRFKHPEGLWVGLWYDPVIFAQNENFFNRFGKFVTTWRSLALPGSWQVIMTDFVASRSAANILYSFVEVQGEQDGLQYFINLKPHIAQYTKFLSTPIRIAALGETDIGVGNFSDGMQYVQHHYPVKILYPADGTPYYLYGAAMLAHTNKEVEAKKFIAWLTSKQVAELLQENEFYYVFTNPEVQPPKDALGRDLILFETVGDYTDEGEKALLNKWINQVRFRKD